MEEKQKVQATVIGRFIGGGLFDPKLVDKEKNKFAYGACIVLNPGEEAKISDIKKKAIQEKWGNKSPAGLQDWTVRQGDDPEYEVSYGNYYINPKSGSAPQTLVKRGNVCQQITKKDDVIYPGCYLAASVSAYAYDGDKSKNIKPGVTLHLRGVLFVKHGERLGDIFNAEKEFAEVKAEKTEDEDDFLAA